MALSNRLIEHCTAKGWWYNDVSPTYADVILDLEIALDSSFGEFFLHAEDGPTFYSRGRELYQVCWFSLNSDYDLDLKRTHEALRLPEEYIPLDSFQGEGGFFYNRQTEAVADIGLGASLISFQNGAGVPQWNSLDKFLEWYFEL